MDSERAVATEQESRKALDQRGTVDRNAAVRGEGPRVSVGGALSGSSAIEETHFQPAFLQPQCTGGADDAGADHRNVRDCAHRFG